METTSLHELFVKELRQMLAAERVLAVALPNLTRAVSDRELKEMLDELLFETRRHEARFDELFDLIGAKRRAETASPLLEELLDQADDLLNEDFSQETLETALIGALRKALHQAIAAYDIALGWAKALGHDDAPDLLAEMLEEKTDADRRLAEAAARLNAAAAEEVLIEAADGIGRHEDDEDAEEELDYPTLR